VDALVLKLVATPLLVVAATLVGRRWGPALSGWLIGLPFTSGPVTFFLAFSHGAPYAAVSAAGTLAGTFSECAFCLAYAWVSRRRGWPVALVLSAVAFGVATAGLRLITVATVPLYVLVVLALFLTLHFMPPAPDQALPSAPVPRWDLPARAALATVFVVALTAAAPALGPRLTGLVAPFPIYASILASFAHQQQGSAGAVLVTRGLLAGLFAFASFFLVLALTLPATSLIVAFALATMAALAVQGVSLALMRARRAGLEQA
jgi:hypothetical protein